MSFLSEPEVAEQILVGEISLPVAGIGCFIKHPKINF